MQTVYRLYKNNLTSFQHNLFNLGLHKPGRLVGFDTLAPTGTLTFQVTHIGSGISYKMPNNTILGPFGMCISGQGVLIMEDSPVLNLSIDTNVGNNETRYDLLVLNHGHQNTTGAPPATYSILKGPLNNPIKPIPADPLKDIIVGVIIIPPGAGSIAAAKYKKSKAPDSGDGEDARLNDVNTFKAIQLFNKSSTTFYLPNHTPSIAGLGNAGFWDLDENGNMFEALPTPTMGPQKFDGIKIPEIALQDGIEIKILINQYIQLRDPFTTNFPSSYYNNGYRPLKIHPSFYNVQIGSTPAVNPPTNDLWIAHFIFYQNKWVLVNVGAQTNNAKFTTGDIIEWYGNINANFDDTGLGVIGGLKEGWALCNGNHGTPDERGLASVMSTFIPDNGAPNLTADYAAGLRMQIAPYNSTGLTEELITMGNLPNASLSVTDPGHSHTAVRTKTDLTSGNSSNRIRDINLGAGGDLSTSSSTTGISVNLPGGEVAYSKIQPVFGCVKIMKL